MSDRKEISPETLVAQANHAIDPITGGVVPPIQLSSTYARDENYQLINSAHSYSRDENPTYRYAESILTELECGYESLLFPSGMAAISTLFRPLARGQRVVAPARMYYGVRKWLNGFAQRREIQLDYYNPADPADLERVIGESPCDLVWVETPANPTWEITDLELAALLAHNAGAVLAVDNTVPTPVHTTPIKLGADFVFHSGTKYLNGHSDITAGVLVAKAKSEHWEAIKFERHYGGNVLGAFEAWLLLRGMRTLYVRVQRASANAMQIATHFRDHPKLKGVLYAGLDSHPGHDVVKQQMNDGFGAMLSLLVKGGWNEAIGVASRLKSIVRATSLGGVESLVEHRKTVEGPESPTPDNLLRLSIGIEDADDLISDLEQALERV